MLGPVITCMRVRASSRQSLAMKGVPWVSASRASTTGWRPRWMSMHGWPTNCGVHQRSVCARSHRLLSASSVASARASAASSVTCAASASSSASHSTFSRASARSCADSALSSNAFSSGVMKRSAFFIVWRRW